MNKLILYVLTFLVQSSFGQVEKIHARWNEGAIDCSVTSQEPLQIYEYTPGTFILRQNPCVNFEANFIYLLVGTKKALLIDTGAEADIERMPLAKTVIGLLPDMNEQTIPLIVTHTHSHLDHRSGDPQFTSFCSVQVVSTDVDSVQAFFGLKEWLNGIALLDLGERTVYVIPAPGHNPNHLVFYDEKTELLFSGDFLLPGRLVVDDISAYRESAHRVVDFIKDRPVSSVLGSHIELDINGNLFPYGSQYHPNERQLELSKDDLFALPNALEDFNGFYASHTNFVISNPIHNLVLLISTCTIILMAIVWMVRRRIMRYRRIHQQN